MMSPVHGLFIKTEWLTTYFKEVRTLIEAQDRTREMCCVTVFKRIIFLVNDAKKHCDMLFQLPCQKL